MKKVVLTIVMFGIAIALVIGVILPIAGNGKSTGQTAKNNLEQVDTSVTSLQTEIN